MQKISKSIESSVLFFVQALDVTSLERGCCRSCCRWSAADSKLSATRKFFPEGLALKDKVNMKQ